MPQRILGRCRLEHPDEDDIPVPLKDHGSMDLCAPLFAAPHCGCEKAGRVGPKLFVFMDVVASDGDPGTHHNTLDDSHGCIRCAVTLSFGNNTFVALPRVEASLILMVLSLVWRHLLPRSKFKV